MVYYSCHVCENKNICEQRWIKEDISPNRQKCMGEWQTHQRVICTLGCLKDLRKGGMDTLIRGLSKFSEKLELVEISKGLLAKDNKDYGAPLIFGRLFKLLGLEDILYAYLSHHNHVFPVKEAIFAMLLNRIVTPSSKLRVYEWLDDVYHPSFETLKLQHFYRSLDFLDEHKEKIEKDLFGSVKNLFNLELDVVFYDTTSIYFEGKGPAREGGHHCEPRAEDQNRFP